jgi:hypothetical protein
MASSKPSPVTKMRYWMICEASAPPQSAVVHASAGQG